MSWRNTARLARHWRLDESEPGRLVCELCPRHCRPRDGQAGFCRVRGSVRGKLRAYNYGRSVAATEEVIETEAVHHYRPGARILSLGNVGCMMSCSFCQNWETSQVKHLDPRSVREYTPEDVVELCLTHDIDVISWTYNDPVVWHEFVVDTSTLARLHGIRTLYKSAFYIEERPAAELVECTDVFSLSLKSMDEDFYRRITKGRLQPVLDRIEQIHRSGRHLELSQLVIPELNDRDQDLERTIRWVTDRLGTRVPLHFVAFHPAYKYDQVERTPVETLERARELAFAAGIEHCYLGNVYRPGLNDTLCKRCGVTLVTRFGLTAEVQNLSADGRCTRCGHASPIVEPSVEPSGARTSAPAGESSGSVARLTYHWEEEVQSAHVRRVDLAEHSLTPISLRPLGGGTPITLRPLGGGTPITLRPLGGGTPITRRLGRGLDRMIASRRSERDRGFALSWPGPARFEVLPVLDRAHFPVEPRFAAPVRSQTVEDAPRAEVPR